MSNEEQKLYEILDRDFGSSWVKRSAFSDFKTTGEFFANFKSYWMERIKSFGIIAATSDMYDRTAELNARRVGDFCVPDPASRRSMGENNVWLVVPRDLALKILVLGAMP